MTESEYTDLLSGGLPPDDFSKTGKLKIINPPDIDFTVYSIGPDKKDDITDIAYDPTNGTISPGDIFLRVPEKPVYPVPQEPVHAANAYELLEQFPNGLPPDNFADTKGRPLSIMESEEDEPLMIFSFGPDTDEAEVNRAAPENPVPTPNPGDSPTRGRNLQLVLRRPSTTPTMTPTPTPSPTTPGFRSPMMMGPSGIFSGGRRSTTDYPPGERRMDPMYDPTNGTITPGDLYIEIPE